jgi:predicted amidohydrolase
MDDSGLSLGLVVARAGDPLAELERFLDTDGVDVFVFPEGFLHSDLLEKTCDLVGDSGRWVISGVDDRRIAGKRFQGAVVINPCGKIVGEHTKTSIGGAEVKAGYGRGDTINVIETGFGAIGVALCYEILYPEVCRILALKGAQLILNPIGVGMFDEKQYSQWVAVAAARAAENRVFVAGCSHCNEKIPLAFAYAPDGHCIASSRDANELTVVSIDFDRYRFSENYFRQRRPELYGELTLDSR